MDQIILTSSIFLARNMQDNPSQLFILPLCLFSPQAGKWLSPLYGHHPLAFWQQLLSCIEVAYVLEVYQLLPWLQSDLMLCCRWSYTYSSFCPHLGVCSVSYNPTVHSCNHECMPNMCIYHLIEFIVCLQSEVRESSKSIPPINLLYSSMIAGRSTSI